MLGDNFPHKLILEILHLPHTALIPLQIERPQHGDEVSQIEHGEVLRHQVLSASRILDLDRIHFVVCGLPSAAWSWPSAKWYFGLWHWGGSCIGSSSPCSELYFATYQTRLPLASVGMPQAGVRPQALTWISSSSSATPVCYSPKPLLQKNCNQPNLTWENDL